MKRSLILIGILIVLGGVLLTLRWSGRAHLNSLSAGNFQIAAGSIGISTNPPVGSTTSHVYAEWLDQQGRVSSNATWAEWHAAEKASWWGKPLDPKMFWKDRVLWLDESAKRDARRHGRFYPPVPFDGAQLTNYIDDDGINWNTMSVEGPNIHYAMSSKERAFWVRFLETHPKPPEDLEEKQNELAVDILGSRYLRANARNQTTDSASIAKVEGLLRSSASELGYPPEALTTDALKWCYVMRKRKEYQMLIAQISGPTDSFVSNFVNGLFVDSALVTQSLAPDQLEAANAWKIAYLQRLRRENTDESYINAYLKAWNLSATKVFGESK